MTICMLNDSYFRSSGSAIVIRRISEALSEIEYYFAGTGCRLPEDLTWVPAGRYRQFNLKTSNPLQLMLEIRRFKRWFKQIKCDLLHCHHRRLAVLLQLSGLPVLYTGHNAFPKSLWFRVLRPMKTTAVSKSVAANLLENTGIQVMAIIGNPALYPEILPVLDVKAIGKRAVCIARLDPVKGHKYLLTAWKILHDRGYECELDLVGEGPLREELEAQAKRDGIAHLIHFCGFTSNVPSVIDNSLFAILVSETEGLGNATTEAAAAGRASLLNAVPGSIDLIPPNGNLRNGLSFGDIPSLAATLEAWFASPEAVVREGQVFFNFLKDSCDTKKIAEEYKEVYRVLLPGAL